MKLTVFGFLEPSALTFEVPMNLAERKVSVFIIGEGDWGVGHCTTTQGN